MANYRFVLTPYALRLLESQNIFFSYRRAGDVGNRLNSFFFFDDQTYVYPHSGILGGQQIFTIGLFSYSLSPMPKGISVGNYCSIAVGLQERRMNHPYERFTTSSITYDRFALFFVTPEKKLIPINNSFIRKPFTIEHDVWIGANVLLSPDITIHTGAIIATQSNVTKDVPPYHIVGGNPARTIKLRFPEKYIEELLASRWFEYDISVLPFKADITIPEFLTIFQEAKENKQITPLSKPKSFLEKLQELSIPFEEI